MSDLFKRVARVTCFRASVPNITTGFATTDQPNANGVVVEGLQMKFTVTRSLRRTPNQCDITIYNLAEQTRAQFRTKPLSVILEAGYDDVYRLLFKGDLQFGMSEEKKPNWETLLQCGDGDRAYVSSQVNKSYKENTTVLAILKDAAASMGLVLPANVLADASLTETMQAGFVATGSSRDVLTKLLAPYGYSWSMQNGVLTVLRDMDVNSGSAILINEENGMIGTPQFGTPPRSGKPPHVTVKCFLYPQIVPGCVIQVSSKALTGQFRAERVSHHGETMGQPWTTDTELSPVGNGS